MTDSGFVAGTLVHTEDGLKPIEQIKVGDRVLSRHESGEGELCYQSVTQTFLYEDRELYYVSWQVLEKETLKPKQIFGEMAVTGAHPIWGKRVVEERIDIDDESHDLEEIPHEINRWMSIEEIYLWYWKAYWDFEWNRGKGGGANVYVELADGPALLGYIQPILQSDDPNVGVGFDDERQWLRNADTEGRRVDFRSEEGVPHNGLSSSEYGTLDSDRVEDMLIDDKQEAYDHPDALDFTKRSGGYLPMRRRVYNLEVANTHTYFIGDLGLWVHDTSGVEGPKLPTTLS
jgi:hypothetical protein